MCARWYYFSDQYNCSLFCFFLRFYHIAHIATTTTYPCIHLVHVHRESSSSSRIRASCIKINMYVCKKLILFCHIVVYSIFSQSMCIIISNEKIFFLLYCIVCTYICIRREKREEREKARIPFGKTRRKILHVCM